MTKLMRNVQQFQKIVARVYTLDNEDDYHANHVNVDHIGMLHADAVHSCNLAQIPYDFTTPFTQLACNQTRHPQLTTSSLSASSTTTSLQAQRSTSSTSIQAHKVYNIQQNNIILQNFLAESFKTQPTVAQETNITTLMANYLSDNDYEQYQ